MQSTTWEAIEINPKGPHDATVIWLHGLGANGYDFVDAIPMLNLASHLNVRFVLPHAPAMPVTLNQGYVMPAWFDLESKALDAVEDEAGIRASQAVLGDLIESELQKGIPSTRLFLFGFSQGGAVALHTALRYKQPLGGVAGLSTYLPIAKTLPSELSPHASVLPVFVGHGLMDEVVPLALGELSCAALVSAGLKPDWHTYPMEHSVCAKEMQDLGDWLTQQLSDA